MSIIDTLYPSWMVSFDIKPSGVQSDWSNIFHMTTGNDTLAYGERTPAVWFRKNTTILHMASGIGEEPNTIFNSPSALELDKWTKLIITQSLIDEEYRYTIDINGTRVYDVPNPSTDTFSNVKVYISNPWNLHALVQIRQLEITTDSGIIPRYTGLKYKYSGVPQIGTSCLLKNRAKLESRPFLPCSELRYLFGFEVFHSTVGCRYEGPHCMYQK